MQRSVLAILLAAIWISLSEFLRNQFLLLDDWTGHYAAHLTIPFPTEPVNGAVWGIWTLLFAVFIHILSRKFTLLETAGLAWLSGFVFMWLVIGNLGVLPYQILYFAVPLSMLEAFGASWIMVKLAPVRPS